MSTHQVRCVVLAIVVLSLAVGCSPAAPSAPYDPAKDPLVNVDSTFLKAPDDDSTVDMDATLYRCLDGNPNTLSPLFGSSNYEFSVNEQLHVMLFIWDKNMTWMVNDVFVESFSEAKDRRSYTVKMRPGLKWHDGHPMTAHDVAYSYEVIMDEKVPVTYYRDPCSHLAGVDALDDLTVKIRFKEVRATNNWDAGFPIIPKHIMEKERANHPDLKTGPYYNDAIRAPIGNGPYKFVEWKDNQHIILERSEHWTGETPHFKRMVYRLVPEANMRLLRFNNGDTDEFRMNPQQFATQTLEGSDFARRGLKVKEPIWTYAFIMYNADGSNPFFGDVNVRRAMTHACDIPRMIPDLCYNLVDQCHGIFHPDSWMYNKNIQLLEYDLVKAAELLDGAGWAIDESRGGWRHKVVDGQPVKFEFTMFIPQGSALGGPVAAILQEDLRSIGVSMKTSLLEWATFSTRTRKHDFQCAIQAWGTGVDPDSQKNIWHTDSYTPDGSSGRNYGRYSNERVDELIELAGKEMDRGKRAKLYQEMSKIIYDEQPYTFLWTRSALWGVRDDMHGVTAGPRGVYLFSPGIRNWWLAPAGQKP